MKKNDDGELISAYKSEFTLSDADIVAISTQFSQASKKASQISNDDLAYSLIDGEWHLIQRAVKEISRNDNVHLEYYYVDITSEVSQ